LFYDGANLWLKINRGPSATAQMIQNLVMLEKHLNIFMENMKERKRN
jgi:hypothetical protein